MGLRARRLGNSMTRCSKIWLVAASCSLLTAALLFRKKAESSRFGSFQTIPLPNVKGRLDHMDVDVKGKRLFVAGLENGTFEVVDLNAGQVGAQHPRI